MSMEKKHGQWDSNLESEESSDPSEETLEIKNAIQILDRANMLDYV